LYSAPDFATYSYLDRDRVRPLSFWENTVTLDAAYRTHDESDVLARPEYQGSEIRMTLTTILGAGGPIANELASILGTENKPFRLVGRNPKPIGDAEVVAADLSDPEQTLAAVAGSDVAILVAGLKYDIAVWRDLWPRIMANTIEACKRAGAKLIFFDNVYAYGRVDGPMVESTPYAPSSRKGEVRAEIATSLMSHVQAGNLTASIARAADFYGPNARTACPTRSSWGRWQRKLRSRG
jgi:NAD(P)H-binding